MWAIKKKIDFETFPLALASPGWYLSRTLGLAPHQPKAVMSSRSHLTLASRQTPKASAMWCVQSLTTVEAGLRQDSQKYLPATTSIFANPEVGT